MRTLIQAHRGASAYAPENTLPAFQLAVEMKADGIECDIHMTKDGQLVVCHDHSVDRTSNGKGRISDLTLKEIKALDFGSRFDARFAGTTAPTLAEMLEVVKPLQVINIEIKQFEHPMGQEKAQNIFYDIVKESGCLDNVIVSSFDDKALSLLKQLHPEMVTCLLYDKMYESARKAQSIGCEAIHPNYIHLTRPTVLSAHRRGMKVNCWTPDDPDEIAYMIDLGCDGVITNRPDVGLEVSRQKEHEK